KGKKGEPKEEEKAAVQVGIYIFPNGDKYDGEYILTDDGSVERQGEGVHSSADGTCYKGQWEKDKMNGNGILTHPGGSSFEGEFSNNRFHGRGRYTFPNGSFYEGEFHENR
ncbi:radial spoke head 1 homolog, partial [Anneissia japonica]|uniref:radial spoke head 1 homolog n=1 Tax=Anneissia japonica TaxID=1529436 RepID=UPI0014255A51